MRSILSLGASSGLAIGSVCSIFGLVGCGDGDAQGASDVGAADQPIRGGTVITGAVGVVDWYKDDGGNCSGSMIAPNVVLTAAHCFETLGAPAKEDGTDNIWIRYYDPETGGDEVFYGAASWHIMPTYDKVGGADDANDDLAVIQIPGRFKNTDYHDYLRIYSDVGSALNTTLTAYGAGIYTYSGLSDENLRTTWFEVENVENDHIVIDSRDLVGVCKGDSGGPLVYFASMPGVSVPTIAGVFSSMNTDEADEGDLCVNNDAPHDDAFYCRTNWDHMQWVEDETGISCELQTGADRDYRRCFELPLIEDVSGEGRELGEGVAIVTALL